MLSTFDPIFNEFDKFMNTGQFNISRPAFSTKSLIETGSQIVDLFSNKNVLSQASDTTRAHMYLKSAKAGSEFEQKAKFMTTPEILKAVQEGKLGGAVEAMQGAESAAQIQEVAGAAIGTVGAIVMVAGVVDGFISRQNTLRLQTGLENLKTEEQILNLRKQGALTEADRLMYEEQIYKNQMEQIEYNRKIGDAEGGMFGLVS